MIRRISPHLKEQIANEKVLREQRAVIANYQCEDCHTTGDWRGLSLSHTKPKGMGGTRHVYDISEVQILCFRCHSLRHGIKEIS